ncbi:SURF1 family protein [Novosphingobium sp. JCM 18896]|uniref:SURF1 family protein n=1 Tax=Novosphingobium sp. JCM 18896 TaxID=2989731 RepID=UPI0022225DF1|nr:SURF1 family protein [Novosphingobium sp. JCM 18896]MCW1432471.1 SURF1 family protein [Novosphingobium sp. JCM 18896]
MTEIARSRARAALPAALLVLAAGFASLGVWQLDRQAWKHDLIAAIASRANGPPSPAPDVATATDAYRRIELTGHYRHEQETLVRAVSDLGSGYWVMTPLETHEAVVLVNRGFITQQQRLTARHEPAGPVKVTGLLRLSEPDGGFLRRNDTVTNRWFSRDVAAIARSHGITHAANYFVDADASLNSASAPVGGLTVLRFSDNHAAYALTWFALTLLSLGAAWNVAVRWRRPQDAPSP